VSRTPKRQKSPGTEYWTRRPFNHCGQRPGAFAKKRTHKAERQEGKKDAEPVPTQQQGERRE
jgi:hypothetical protein